MDESERLRRSVIHRLESLHRAGVQQLPVAAGAGHDAQPAAILDSQPDPSSPARQESATVMGTTSRHATSSSNAMSSSQAAKTNTLFETDAAGASSAAPNLTVLAEEVAGCTRCDELARTRRQTVFGVGNPEARLCFVGEAPGADEDRLGEPFVGRAGGLLTKIIEACGMRREDVYILNVLKCRPPGNRNPTPAESHNCRRFLNRQLELVHPEFLCCLGAVAAQNLLDTTTPIGRLRGRVHDYRGIKVVCTYHPAYLLRNPAAKKPTWDDMQLLLREMGLEVPQQ